MDSFHPFVQIFSFSKFAVLISSSSLLCFWLRSKCNDPKHEIFSTKLVDESNHSLNFASLCLPLSYGPWQAVTIRTFWWYCRVVKAICKLCLDMQKLSMRKTQQTTLSELYYVSISGTRAPEDEDKEGQILYFDKTLFARKRAVSIKIYTHVFCSWLPGPYKRWSKLSAVISVFPRTRVGPEHHDYQAGAAQTGRHPATKTSADGHAQLPGEVQWADADQDMSGGALH